MKLVTGKFEIGDKVQYLPNLEYIGIVKGIKDVYYIHWINDPEEDIEKGCAYFRREEYLELIEKGIISDPEYERLFI